MTTPHYTLIDGETRHKSSPQTFEIPDLDARQNVPPEHFARLIFQPVEPDVAAERMWVKVTARHANGSYIGTLANQPIGVRANFGDAVTFEARHIIGTCLPIAP